MSCVYAWVTQKTVLNVVTIRPSEADSHSAGQETFAEKRLHYSFCQQSATGTYSELILFTTILRNKFP
jgi:hypothetical protein